MIQTTPVLLGGHFRHLPRCWSLGHLRRAFGTAHVRVHHADDGVFARDGLQLATQARDMPAGELFDAIDAGVSGLSLQQAVDPDSADPLVRRLGQQLLADLPVPAPYPREGADRTLWIASGEQVTTLHRDTYDNLLVVARGRKRITLFAPSDRPYLYERIQQIRFKRTGRIDHYLFCEVDPAAPDLQRYPDFVHATAREVTVGAGDAVFIPADWYHHVRSEGETVAMSHWWDVKP